MKDITVDDEKNVKKLIKMLKACDGETINHVLKESYQIDYAFNSHLKTSELLREKVEDLEDIEMLVKRLAFVKCEMNDIELWTVKHGVDIEMGIDDGDGVGLCTHLGNLSEISDIENPLEWYLPTFKDEGMHYYDYYNKRIDPEIIERVSFIEYVVNGENFEHLQDAIKQYETNKEQEFFFRYWVKVKGTNEAVESNITSLTNKPLIRKLRVEDLTLTSITEEYGIKIQDIDYEVHVINDKNGRIVTTIYGSDSKMVSNKIKTNISNIVAKLDN